MREPTGRLHGISSQSICCCVMLKSKSDLLSLLYADDGALCGQKPEILEFLAGASALPAPSRTKQRRLYSRWSSAGGILPLQAPPTLTPQPREKQLSPSENLQCGNISALVTGTTLITAQKSDANAAFVGGKASPAHLLSWRVEAAAGLSKGGVTREHRRIRRLILAKSSWFIWIWRRLRAAVSGDERTATPTLWKSSRDSRRLQMKESNQSESTQDGMEACGGC